MGRIIIFENPRQKAKKETKRTADEDDEEDDPDEVMSVGLGSGDVWPCYWQPYFIAAWKMVKNKDNAAVTKYVEENGIEQAVLAGLVEARRKAILEVDDNALEMLAMAMFGGGSTSRGFSGGLRGMPSARPPSGNPLYPNGDMKYFVNSKVMSLLSIVHLDVIADLFHDQYVASTNILTPSRMTSMLAMMEKLQHLLPRTEEDLVGTPWEPSSARNQYELADGRWDDLQASFAAAVTQPGTVGVIY